MRFLLLFIHFCFSASWWDIDHDLTQSGEEFGPVLNQYQFQVSFGAEFPYPVQQANNNVGIIIHDDRIFIGFRSSKSHFASNETEMIIASAPYPGNGLTFAWEIETVLQIGFDMREPYFIVAEEVLFFFFFKAGTNPIEFSPDNVYRMQREGNSWSEPEAIVEPGEVMWQFSEENGTHFVSSYFGEHYTANLGSIVLHFNKSADGISWEPADEQNIISYSGGISEVGFAFDLEGNLFGVGRNEDGDSTGWGSRTFWAEKNSLGKWNWFKERSDPYIYESVRMFRHANELFLIARTDPTGTFFNERNSSLPENLHHLIDLGAYSTRPHGTALWKMDKTEGSFEKLLDLPGCGDTAFPSIVRISGKRYLVANYTSPLRRCEDWSWFEGQVSPLGTGIYFAEIEFVAK